MFKINTCAISTVTTLVMQPFVFGHLIVNGDFESGNTAFNTDYSFAVANTAEGQYGIGSNPQAFNQFFANSGDHTTGSGNMMFVNASQHANQTVWSQLITVNQNSQYNFSGWLTSLYPTSAARLRFTINDAQVGDDFVVSLTTGVWSPFFLTWNSGGSSSALLRIVDTNTDFSGNDFALDDLAFNAVVPEPSTALLLLGAAVLTFAKRRISAKGSRRAS